MVTVEALGFTLDDLISAIANDEVRSQTHPEFPELSIFNYSEGVQFRNKWNKITLACRGLILNTTTGEVVARPWKKFFNFGQRDNEIDSLAPVEVTDKVDGSLGILYHDGARWAIATRGSFASDQAIHATELLDTKYHDYIVDTIGGYWIQKNTYLFEIVYPNNRIVVNYGDMDDLVLLGAVDKEHGYYYGPTAAGAQIAWPGPVAEVFWFNNFVDALANWPQRPGKEGVVVRSGDRMVKLKQVDYVELHRIVTNLSPKTIWEMLGDGKTIADICSNIPDEFHQYVTDIGRNLLDQASEIKYDAEIDYRRCVTAAGGSQSAEPNRREFARFATQSKHKSLLFLMLDGKPVDSVVWHNIKPRGDIKSLVKDEG